MTYAHQDTNRNAAHAMPADDPFDSRSARQAYRELYFEFAYEYGETVCATIRGVPTSRPASRT